VRRIAARALAHGEAILDDPGEIPRDDPRCPSAPHDATAATMPTMPAACTVAATSCTRTAAAPLAIAHVAVASEPAKRSSTGAGRPPERTLPLRREPLAMRPRKVLRL